MGSRVRLCIDVRTLGNAVTNINASLNTNLQFKCPHSDPLIEVNLVIMDDCSCSVRQLRQWLRHRRLHHSAVIICDLGVLQKVIIEKQ